MSIKSRGCKMGKGIQNNNPSTEGVNRGKDLQGVVRGLIRVNRIKYQVNQRYQEGCK